MAATATQAKTNEVAITPQNQLQIVKQWGEAFNNLVETQETPLTQNERAFGMSIITNLTNRCIQGGIKANELNMTDFLEQVKHCSKLQLSINEQELYLDIRNSKDTGLKTVKISRQYQGIQKLMTRYCTKNIVRFKDGIVYNGDFFETEEDFSLGITKIVKHTKKADIDHNKLENIKCAYAIAYVEEYGKLVPYTVIVDKNRIIRARNAATTDKVWASDLSRMVTKTAYWVLWAFMKPYIELPIGLQESVIATDDEMDWDKQAPEGVDLSQNYDIIVGEAETSATKDGSVDDSQGTENEIIVGKEVVKDDTDILYVDYKTEYSVNKDKYERAPYPDGRDPYNKETKQIRVRLKK